MEQIAKIVKRRQCNFTTSEYKGIFLDGTHLKPSEIVRFVNHWLQKTWNYDTVFKCLNWVPSTSVDWRSFSSEVTEWWVDNQDSIGGEEIEVETDETLFVRRKYDRGRMLRQLWVFGGIERISKKCFIVPLVVQDRGASILIPII